MIRFFAAAASLTLSAAAAAQPASCLTKRQVSDLFVFTAPSLIEAAAKRCGPHLPATAFLTTGSGQLARRLASEGESSGTSMTSVIGAMAGEAMPDGVSEETTRSLVRDIFAAEFTKEIKPADCGSIDELVSALSPLPARNIGAMMAAFMTLAERDGSKAPFRICADQPR